MSDSTRGRATVAELWSLPNVDGPIVGLRRDAPSRARDADATRATESARQAEIDRGYEAGVSAGRAELQKQNDALAAQVARLDAILSLLARPLPTLEGEVEQQLVLLALAVGKQLARRELKADPGQIAALIREAVGRLPAAARSSPSMLLTMALTRLSSRESICEFSERTRQPPRVRVGSSTTLQARSWPMRPAQTRRSANHECQRRPEH